MKELSITTNNIKLKRNNKYKIKERTLSEKMLIVLTIGLIILSGTYVIFGVEYQWHLFSWEYVLVLLGRMFNFSEVPLESMIKIVGLLLNTILLGAITTMLGTIVAIPLGLAAARNISSKRVSSIIRAINSVIRAIPTIVWVMVFVAGYGLTATTATIGMSFHTISFFVKAFSEAFEEVDKETIEALYATGANKMQVILNAILPSAKTKIISWIATRTEINFAIAVVIGPAVGVPDTIGTAIGVFSRSGNYSSMTFAVICVLITTLLFETLAVNIKKRSRA